MIGFEARKYVVTGYQAFGWRQFQEDRNGHSHVVTTMQLRLDIRQDGGPPGRRATLAVIDFGAGEADQIGQIAPRPDPHAEQFELDVALTAADFDHYWNILTDIGQTHLRCEVQVPPGEDIAEFEIVSRKHTEAAP